MVPLPKRFNAGGGGSGVKHSGFPGTAQAVAWLMVVVVTATLAVVVVAVMFCCLLCHSSEW